MSWKELLRNAWDGPGEVRISLDTDNGAYHKQDGHISASWLKEASSSLFRFSKYPDKPREEKDYFVIGEAVHTKIFEADEFENRFIILDEDQRPDKKVGMTGKENKEWLAKLKAGDKKILTKDQLDEVSKMVERPLEDPTFLAMMTNNIVHIEPSIWYYDPFTGAPLKTRPDVVLIKNGTNKAAIIDAKTMPSADPRQFGRKCVDMQYPTQAHTQIDGVEKAFGVEVVQYLYLCIEKEYPYDFCLANLSLDDIEVARGKTQTRLADIRWALENDIWPGYSMLSARQNSIVDIKLPPWFY